MNLSISPAASADFDAVRAVDETMGGRPRAEFLRKAIDEDRCLIAKIDGIAAGFAVTEQTFFGQSFIALLIVRPEYQRRGVASALIRRVEANCPTEKLFTSTNKSNIVMQKVCDALGFVRSGYIENLDEGDPEIIYFKRVKNKND